MVTTFDRAGLARRVFAGEGADERIAAQRDHSTAPRAAFRDPERCPQGSLAVYDIRLVEGDYATVLTPSSSSMPLSRSVSHAWRAGVAPEDAGSVRIRAQAPIARRADRARVDR